jgi:hypothetical protein
MLLVVSLIWLVGYFRQKPTTELLLYQAKIDFLTESKAITSQRNTIEIGKKTKVIMLFFKKTQSFIPRSTYFGQVFYSLKADHHLINNACFYSHSSKMLQPRDLRANPV